MERQVAELEKIVKNQSDELLEMKRKIDILEDIVLRLSICKASNGNFPYYDFILSYGITPDQQTRINRLFMLLSEKLAGRKFPLHLRETTKRCHKCHNKNLAGNG